MILLTGATGTIGKEIVPLLALGSVPARAMVRDVSKAEPLRAAGLEVVVGNLDDPASVAAALRGVDRAFLLAANSQDQLTQEIGFIDAAKAAQVSQIVKLSAVGADANSTAPLKRFHALVEAHNAASGVNYANVQPGFYMQNMLYCAQTIAAENKFYLPMGKGAVGSIDARDVAEFVVELLTATAPESGTYVVTGSQTHSFAQIAQEFSTALGRRVEYVDMPPSAEFRAQLLNWGPNEWYADAVLELFAAISRSETAYITDTFETTLGYAPRSYATFIDDHLGVFG